MFKLSHTNRNGSSPSRCGATLWATPRAQISGCQTVEGEPKTPTERRALSRLENQAKYWRGRNRSWLSFARSSNSTAVSGSSVDSNGVKIATLRGSWAHATHFTGHRIVRGTEYVGWVNSHGSRYKSSDEGEPADMCWMTRALVEQFVSTASGYGSPYIVFPESVFDLDRSLYVKLRIPFPTNWRF